MKTSVFIKVICTSYAAVKLKPKKNWGWNRTQTLGYQSSVLQLSYQVNWELVKKQFCNIPIDGEEMEVNIWKIRYYELTHGVWITNVSTCLFYHLQVYYELTSSQFPVDLIAQLVRTALVSQRSWVRILFKPEFFRFWFQSCWSFVYNCNEHVFNDFFVGFITLAYSDLKVTLSYPQWPCPLQTYIV